MTFKFPALDITDRSDGKVIGWDDDDQIHKYVDAPAAELGAWQSYTPALTAASSNPVLGSSTLTGRYKMIDDTTMAFSIELSITTGGSWNAGSGRWKFSLPSGVTTARTQPVAAHVLDAGVGFFAAIGIIEAGTDVIEPVVVADQAGNREMAHNAPVTWATGDVVRIAGVIEVDA